MIVPKTGAGDAAVQANANTAEVFVVHASIHNHFNQERSLSSRQNFKLNRTAALAEWRGLGAE